MAILRIFLLILSLALPGGALAQETVEGPSGTISTQSDRQIDAGIAVRIREILRELGNFEDVTVTVSEGVVTLRGTTNSAAEAQSLTQLVTRIDGVVAIRNEVRETTDLTRRLNPAVDRFEARIEALIAAAPLLAIAASALIGISFLGYLVARRQRFWAWLAPNAFIADLYAQIVQIVFVLAGIVAALDILNASALLGTILGAAGIFGLAIGFAVRDTVENYIASIMLSVRQPFRPNDTIEINGDIGKVVRLTSRATILLSFDGNQIRIPNATVFKSRIVNFSINPEIRFMFTINVSTGSNISKARDLATQTVQSLPFVLDRPPASSWIAEITDRGVEVVITGWVDQRETSMLLARGEALRLVKLAYRKAGIEMPDTTYRIRMEESAPAAPDQTAPTAPRESSRPSEVTGSENDALVEIIDSERERGEIEDFLDDAARKE